MNGAESLVRTLVAGGVDVCFTNPGTSEMHFVAALDRVEELGARSRPVLLCSEHEPLQCHRCLLVGRRLFERGVDVEHILRDGRIEPHAEAEDRLLKLTRQTENDLFASREQRLAVAYRNQALKITRRSK